MKKLHSFEIKQEKEVEKVDVRQENGQEITVKTKVKEEVPIEIVLKEPSRRERQELSLFYGVAYNDALEKRLLPRVLLVQKFLKDANSPLSQDEDKNLAQMYQKLESLSNDYMRANALPESDEQKKRKDQLLKDFLGLQKKATDIETSYRSLFAHTAENYAQNKAITWLVLNLSYIANGNDFTPIFKGKDYDEKETYLFDLEDKEDPIYFKSVDKLSTYWTLYFLGQATSAEDFKKIEEQLLKELKEQEEANKKEEEEAKSEEVKSESTPEPVVEG